MTTPNETKNLEAKLPAHNCGLYLEHNRHRDTYEHVARWVAENSEHYAWKDDASKARSIATGDVWTLQWYPLTPTGFFAIAAPTLDELLAFAATVPNGAL